MAAIFPLDTTVPWTFNGVTYQYDAAEDRWFVISTTKTDLVDDSLESLERGLETTNDIIDKEIENRSNLLDVAASKNNQQDAALLELDQRLDAIGEAAGALQFKGRYKYVLEKSEAACTAVYAQCLIDAAGDPIAASACNSQNVACYEAISDPYPNGSFTSRGATNVIEDIEEFVISGIDLDGQTIDWLNVAEVGDYLEFFGVNDGDTALYEIIEEPKVFSVERSIRVKFIRETAAGDGNFNLEEQYDIRVFKTSQGLSLADADERYVLKPYVVYFEDDPDNITPVAESGRFHNGELWFDTSSLEVFIWNNNSWVGASPPPSQDIVVQSLQQDVDKLNEEAFVTNQTLNTLISESLLENNIYYSDEAPSGDATGTLRNGDIWVDSDDLTIKFYSGGAWINPDRTVGGNYLEKSGGEMTGDLTMQGGPEDTGSNIYLRSNGYIRFGYGPTNEDQYGGYIFQRDINTFEIGAYNDKTLKFKGLPSFDKPPIVPDPTENQHAVSRGYANNTYLRDGFQANQTINFRTGGTTNNPYKITNQVGGATLFKVDASAGKDGPVIFKSDNGCYQEYSIGNIVTARFELEKYTLFGADTVKYVGETSHDFTGKVNFIRVGDEKQGFKIQGRTTDGTIGDLFHVYHNGGSVPDAVNYNGKITSDSNIVNKKYVDDAVGTGGAVADTNQPPPGRVFQKLNATSPTESGKFTYYETGGQLKLGLNRRDVEGVKWLDIDFNDTLAAPVLFRFVELTDDTTHTTVRYGAIDKIVASEGGQVVCDVRYHQTNGSLTNGSNYYITIGGLI